MIDKETIEKIQSAAQIVDVVSDFVTLRKRGVNFVGLCPFHEDRRPSFYVSPSKNICKCFSCGAGGTPVHFIMKHEQMTYYEALKYLAKKYNIEVKEKELSNEEQQAYDDRESMFILNGFAQKTFTSNLLETKEGKTIGISYFRERGFRDDTIKKFQLGYAMEQKDAFTQKALKEGYQKQFLEETGLSLFGDDHYCADRFRGRVIFPVHTLSGKIVAFGGRVLKKNEKTAKYINSPESSIYHKGNELYGLFFARQAIVKNDKCFLVEGYTDVISMHQSGIENVVASSGTALTQGQIKLIHRFTNNVTVLYDGDAPGIKAALRGIDLLLEAGLNIKVLLLPEGEDPDSFARSHSSSEFISFIKENETDFVKFKTKLLLADAGDDPQKKAQLINDVVGTIAIIPQEITRSVYIKECAILLDTDERVLLHAITEKRHELLNIRISQQERGSLLQKGNSEKQETDAASETERNKETELDPYEASIIYYIIRYGNHTVSWEEEEESHYGIRITVTEFVLRELANDDIDFENPAYTQIIHETYNLCIKNNLNIEQHFLRHSNPVISQIAADMISEEYPLSKSNQCNIQIEDEKLVDLVSYSVLNYKNAILKRDLERIDKEIKEAQEKNEGDKITSLMEKLIGLKRTEKDISKYLGERVVKRM